MGDDDRYDLDALVGDEAKPSARPGLRGAPGGDGKAPKRRGLPEWGAIKVWLFYKGTRLAGGFLVVWFLFLFHSLWPESAEYRATVHASSGTVRLQIGDTQLYAPNPADRWTAVWPGREVRGGDLLRTAANSTLDLEFYEGSQMRLNPDTRVQVDSLSFIRSSGARRRRLTLQGGSLYVRTTVPVTRFSSFEVQASGRTIAGWHSFYQVDPWKVAVLTGQVTVRHGNGTPLVVPAGQVCNLQGQVMRPLNSAERQQLQAAGGKLPKASGIDAGRAYAVSYELRFVLHPSAWLLRMVKHESGEGNPFAGLKVTSSGRYAAAKKRLSDLQTALAGGQGIPASVRLDDFKAMGVDDGLIPELRSAFYRGQLIRYEPVGGNVGFRAVVKDNSREHVNLTCTAAGVQKRAGK